MYKITLRRIDTDEVIADVLETEDAGVAEDKFVSLNSGLGHYCEHDELEFNEHVKVYYNLHDPLVAAIFGGENN